MVGLAQRRPVLADLAVQESMLLPARAELGGLRVGRGEFVKGPCQFLQLPPQLPFALLELVERRAQPRTVALDVLELGGKPVEGRDHFSDSRHVALERLATEQTQLAVLLREQRCTFEPRDLVLEAPEFAVLA
jgi:hypothetical protein